MVGNKGTRTPPGRPSHLVIKQCLKGKSVACSRSKDINERLTWEAIGKVVLMAQIIDPGQVQTLLSFSFH